MTTLELWMLIAGLVAFLLASLGAVMAWQAARYEEKIERLERRIRLLEDENRALVVRSSRGIWPGR